MRRWLVFAIMIFACRDDDGSGTGGSEAATGSATSGAGDDGVAQAGVCVQDCVGDGDCAEPGEVCRDGLCGRPTCEEVSCDAMNLPGWSCVSTQGTPACVLPCQTDTDCPQDELVCDGMADDGTRYCVFDLFCTTDVDCDAGLACHPVSGRGMCIAVCESDAGCDATEVCLSLADDGTQGCIPRQCSSDAECSGMGHCDGGFCRCSGDDECADGICFEVP